MKRLLTSFSTKPINPRSGDGRHAPPPVPSPRARWRRGTSQIATEPGCGVLVWDRRAEIFRRVDPADLRDPLHETARLLSRLQADMSPGPPHAPTRCNDTWPSVCGETDQPSGRSPFGGGTAIASEYPQ